MAVYTTYAAGVSVNEKDEIMERYMAEVAQLEEDRKEERRRQKQIVEVRDPGPPPPSATHLVQCTQQGLYIRCKPCTVEVTSSIFSYFKVCIDFS